MPRAKAKPRALSHTDRLCVEFYVGTPGASQVAAYAKFHPESNDRSCNRNAGRFFQRPAVKAYIAERERQIEVTFRLETEWVIQELVDNVKRCKQATPVLDAKGEPTGEYRFDANGANKALELLGKHLKMWTERVELVDPLKERLAQMTDQELLAQMEALKVSDELYAHLSSLGIATGKAKTTH